VKRRRLYRFRRHFRPVLKEASHIFLMSLGVGCAALGLKGFLIPNGFIDGGITGISLLLSQITHIPVAGFILLLNLPFLTLGFKQLSGTFALKTGLSILALAAAVHWVSFPTITSDKLLISVFGGLLLGAGIGLVMRGGAVIDGTEVLALTISKRTVWSIGDVILIANVVIFGAAALMLTLEQALYSILTYLAASKSVDFIVHGIEEYTGMTIISNKSDVIKSKLVNDMKRGVTVYKGKSGYGKRGHNNDDIDIIFTIVTRLEISKLKRVVEDIDKAAFVFEHSINDTMGGMVKRRWFK
jgi:uncharacterized membrane-anchored protein YitT (DUF2179 family)